MGEWVKLKAGDGFELSAYLAGPAGEPLAGLVIVQEIFGVNGHIRSVADGYAKDGFLAIAPALFDRIERDVELGYEGADMQKAMTFIPKLDMERCMLDVAAAVEFARDGEKSRCDRLLSGRNAGLAVRHSLEDCRCCGLLRRPHRQLRQRNAARPGDAPFRQSGRAYSRF